MGQTTIQYQPLASLPSGGGLESWVACARAPDGRQYLVVIERIPRVVSDNTQLLNRAYQQTQRAAALSHRALAQAHDVFELDDAYYVALELASGEDLEFIWRSFVNADEPIPLALTARVIAEAAAALDFARRKTSNSGEPLIHGHLSLRRLRLSYEGKTKVVGHGTFPIHQGVARARGGLGGSNLHYCAPEQFKGGDVDARTDMFALGVILWEMLTGRRLFERAGPYEVMRAVCEEPVASPSKLAEHVPSRLDTIISRALAKDPSKRYTDYAEFLGALEGILQLPGVADQSMRLGTLLEERFPQRAERWRDVDQAEKTGDFQQAAALVAQLDRDSVQAPQPTRRETDDNITNDTVTDVGSFDSHGGHRPAHLGRAGGEPTRGNGAEPWEETQPRDALGAGPDEPTQVVKWSDSHPHDEDTAITEAPVMPSEQDETSDTLDRVGPETEETRDLSASAQKATSERRDDTTLDQTSSGRRDDTTLDQASSGRRDDTTLDQTSSGRRDDTTLDQARSDESTDPLGNAFQPAPSAQAPSHVEPPTAEPPAQTPPDDGGGDEPAEKSLFADFDSLVEPVETSAPSTGPAAPEPSPGPAAPEPSPDAAEPSAHRSPRPSDTDARQATGSEVGQPGPERASGEPARPSVSLGAGFDELDWSEAFAQFDETDPDDEPEQLEPAFPIDDVLEPPDRRRYSRDDRASHSVLEIVRHSQGRTLGVETLQGFKRFYRDKEAPFKVRLGLKHGKVTLRDDVDGWIRRRNDGDNLRALPDKSESISLKPGDQCEVRRDEVRYRIRVFNPPLPPMRNRPHFTKQTLMVYLVALLLAGTAHGGALLGVMAVEAIGVQMTVTKEPDQEEVFAEGELTDLEEPEEPDKPEPPTPPKPKPKPKPEPVDPTEKEVKIPNVVKEKLAKRVEEKAEKSSSAASDTQNVLDALKSPHEGSGESVKEVVSNVDAVKKPKGSEGGFKVGGTISKLEGDEVNMAVGGGGDVGKLSGKKVGKEVAQLDEREKKGKVRGKVSGVKALTKVQGSLSRSDVYKTIDKYQGQILGCYERRLLDKPSLSGRVVFTWTVAANGSVNSARQRSSTVSDAKVSQCVLKIIRKMKFPQPEGGEVEISYPFMFQQR
jgi:serine/threonine protein kinase/outer membrane biosynthesis protein TonB